MIEYTYYYNGRKYVINANSVSLALDVARERYSAQFARECVLVSAVDSATHQLLKAVS